VPYCNIIGCIEAIIAEINDNLLFLNNMKDRQYIIMIVNNENGMERHRVEESEFPNNFIQ